MRPDRQRLFDLFAASLLLLLSAPVLLLAAALVKISSPGPIFCRQRFFSRGGQALRILQFRTTVAVQNGGPVMAITGARRLTPIGRFLRYTGLEALPQLISVLHGDMSLAGPWPQSPGVTTGAAMFQPCDRCFEVGED
jgi:undecaprenyl-phosphate galactose phosphotransferase/putative colanic acid biosynthesis UDP-glucose lipid carrier transferase